MKGWLKMLANGFEAWNAAQTIIANENGLDCDPYTFSRPDADPLYVWARVEHDFIDGDTKTEEEAVSEGMQ